MPNRAAMKNIEAWNCLNLLINRARERERGLAWTWVHLATRANFQNFLLISFQHGEFHEITQINKKTRHKIWSTRSKTWVLLRRLTCCYFSILCLLQSIILWNMNPMPIFGVMVFFLQYHRYWKQEYIRPFAQCLSIKKT